MTLSTHFERGFLTFCRLIMNLNYLNNKTMILKLCDCVLTKSSLLVYSLIVSGFLDLSIPTGEPEYLYYFKCELPLTYRSSQNIGEDLRKRLSFFSSRYGNMSVGLD